MLAFARQEGIAIQRVLSDNGEATTVSFPFRDMADAHRITLKRTRPYRPQTNGKAEAFNKTLQRGVGIPAALYLSNDERRRALARWLRFYNHRRPHTALDGLTPMAILVNNVGGKHT